MRKQRKPVMTNTEKMGDAAGEIQYQNVKLDRLLGSELSTTDNPRLRRMGDVVLRSLMSEQFLSSVDVLEYARNTLVFSTDLELRVEKYTLQQSELDVRCKELTEDSQETLDHEQELLVEAIAIASKEDQDAIDSIKSISGEIKSNDQVLSELEITKSRKSITDKELTKLQLLLNVRNTFPNTLTTDQYSALRAMMEYGHNTSSNSLIKFTPTQVRDSVFLQPVLIDQNPKHSFSERFFDRKRDSVARIAELLQTHVVTFETLCAQLEIFEEKLPENHNFTGSKPYQLLAPESASSLMYQVKKELSNYGFDLRSGWYTVPQPNGTSETTRVYTALEVKVLQNGAFRNCQWDEEVTVEEFKKQIEPSSV